ncbi:MAG TPA: biotin/lipoyl-containing protein, partial [Solirubrobacterales bacterium]
MAEIVMPRLSDSMEEGTILTWMKQEGDEVAVGDELVEIETDKANMAYESDVAGTLSRILAQEGDTLAIGTPIAVVGDPGDGNGAAPATQGAQPADTSPTDTPAGASSSNAGDPLPPHTPQEGITPTSAQSAGVSVGEGTDEGTRVKASPIAKRIARESGVDLSTLTGSGPGGRIVKADVEKAGGGTDEGSARAGVPAASAPVPPTVGVDEEGTTGAPGETAKGQTTYQELTRLQQVVARRMSESKAT